MASARYDCTDTGASTFRKNQIRLQEFQRISADNSRLHRALNRIKPTVPSLKEVQIRAKDLERWYKNGCKLPDVLYDNVNGNAPVIERTPAAISPVRHAQRSLSHTECSADVETATNDCISIPKQMKHTNKKEHTHTASPKSLAAGREFDSNKSLMGRLRPELLRDVCDIKQPSVALRQLLQAACSALGKFILTGVILAYLICWQENHHMQLLALIACQINVPQIVCLDLKQ